MHFEQQPNKEVQLNRRPSRCWRLEKLLLHYYYATKLLIFGYLLPFYGVTICNDVLVIFASRCKCQGCQVTG